MNNITCDICQDLMPLVKDGIASEDSTKAVKDHLKTCPACSKLYQNENIEVKNIDDHRILTQIRKRLYLAGLITAFIGALIGLVLTGGAGLFYNILIMPTIGIIGYFALKKQWYYMPISLFILSYVWLLITYLSEGILDETPLGYTLLIPANWALIYSGLAMLGIIIGKLLSIAFKKEENRS